MSIVTILKREVKELNLFEDAEKTNVEDIKNQRVATVVFIILLILSILALLLFTSLTNITKTVVVQQPTVLIYQELQSKYPNTLVCPCSSILNEYRNFIISLRPQFNQICSSDFVSKEWLNYVNYRSFTDMKYHYIYDFRHSAYSFFQMLHTLCTLASQAIDDQLVEFYATSLLTVNAISQETFLLSAEAAQAQVINATKSTFLTSLNSLRITIQGNAIVNRLETNYQLYTRVYANEWYDQSYVRLYPPNNCTCQYSSSCNTTTGIYTVSRANKTENSSDLGFRPTDPLILGHLEFSVAGVNVGCFPLDSVLQSDLSCLYNSSCLSQLNAYLIDSLYPFNATALHGSSDSVLTVSELVDGLMVDEWLFRSSFEYYISACSPRSCSYTYTQQFDVIYVITTTVGFIGGVVTILTLITLPLVTFLRKRISVLKYPSINVAHSDEG